VGALHVEGSHIVTENRIQLRVPKGVDWLPGAGSKEWGVRADATAQLSAKLAASETPGVRRASRIRNCPAEDRLSIRVNRSVPGVTVVPMLSG